MQKLFDDLYKKAERTITSGTALSKLLDEVFLKVGEASESFYALQDTIIAMVRMLRAWIKGDYKNISTKAIITVVAALIYFVNPIDLIPDFIPILGQIDDLFILGYLIKIINKELERYMSWEKENMTRTSK